MSYTPMSDLGQQGLFDITRTLLQQPDLASLCEALSQLVKRSALADNAAIVLWQAQTQRASYYASREKDTPIKYEDETVLAHGPVRSILSRPDTLHCSYEEFCETWPQLAAGGLYPKFGHYCLPPLRERPEDIPLLAKAFTFKIARRLGRNIDSIPAETLRTLSNMEWPGNVRELENVIERAVLLTRGNVLQLSLPDIALPEPETPPAATVVAQEGEDEYQLIVRVLKETNGVVAGPKGAAQRLGLKRTTLLSRMKRLGIDKSALI